MHQISVGRLFEDNKEALELTWVAGLAAADVQISSSDVPSASGIVGHLNLIHLDRIQVIGSEEISHAENFTTALLDRQIAKLFAAHPPAIIIADDAKVPTKLREGADSSVTALFSTPLPAAAVIDMLRSYLSVTLAESILLHGVLMDVLGLGVLITGESGVGKSELGMELISRGHGLIADDVVEVSRVTPKTLVGTCPPMLKDFLEVRGLGMLNIRTIFGEAAVRPKIKLRLITHLQKPGLVEAERLPLDEQFEEILGVIVKKVIIPVAAGRNLAVLVEAAVRNYILQLRGLDSNREFIERQRQQIESESSNRDSSSQ